MDCFQDFCLACDKESHGPYCSQACRLADLERGNTSVPQTPLSPSSQSQSRLSWSSTASAYVLPPAVDFTDKNIASSPYTEQQQYQTSYFMRTSAQQPSTASSQRSLTPCSSRTSLSSTTSQSSTNGVSEQARLQLESYFSSFTQARAAKRRPSLR
ncbi:hypothetical protein BAUCODRAFT_461019 [Baudoinia panamericana UAMH 10762]|uniref:Uncharacterized protein n=1 Tax=Baudoinia panamericana (strain UAMH 10762) TaxID=717646 RepID=M2LT15_BAUPA|nr:uncharacterized protein BAUCODRAFT_461019 [Baudoinia panamericana UAMH 10762]EMC97652.1 hypothetical protein BAUCODRAFT_461019 [Baudoinia panamericana UAMH 10762]